jgi:DNA-directed RNA polymerase specialized sigma24 family protein
MAHGHPYRRPGATLTQQAFDSLLAALDPDRERAGAQYEFVRRKLLTFFECRGSPTPEDETDETLSRVATRLSSGEAVQNVPAYCYGVARLVALESRRARLRPLTGLESSMMSAPVDSAEDDDRMRCLDHCLAALPDESRLVLLGYYEGDKGARIRQRQTLSEGLGTMNALRIRVHRLRARIEECVRGCLRGRLA